MKKLLFCFSLICCIVPMTVTAADLFNTSDSFKVAKAVKLGRGKAYSVATDSAVNTGSGGTKIKECPANCADCDDSTSCNVCKSGYGKHRSGECVACPDNCKQCIYNNIAGDRVMMCSGSCAAGYHLERLSNGISDCCPTGKILSDVYPYLCVPETCEAGTYRSGSNLCESCPTGTYSTESNASSCKNCSTLFVGSNNTCTACSTQGSCIASSCGEGYYNGSPNNCTPCSSIDVGSNATCTACSTQGSCIARSCDAGYYLSGSNCVACSSGTYSKGGTATSCSSCSSIYAGGSNIKCTSCTTTGTCTGSLDCSGCPTGYTKNLTIDQCASSAITENRGCQADFGFTCGRCLIQEWDSQGSHIITNDIDLLCPQGHIMCPQGNACTNGGHSCKTCAAGSNLTYGNCNCPAGKLSDGLGFCR